MALAIDSDSMTGWACFRQFRHVDGQDAILVISRAFRLIDIVDVKQTAHAALAALAADIIAFFVLFIIRLLILRGNRQVVIVVSQGDIFLLEARQLSHEVVTVLIVLDIDFKCWRMEILHERLIKDIHEAVEYIVFSLKIVMGNK